MPWNDPSFISRIETWVYVYNPETKHQSAQWNSPSSPRPKKARQVHTLTKCMLIVFFNIVHQEFVSRGQTVNSKFYCQVLRRGRLRVMRVLGERGSCSSNIPALKDSIYIPNSSRFTQRAALPAQPAGRRCSRLSSWRNVLWSCSISWFVYVFSP
ncbi:uncharacterized protein Hap1MRO34_024099 [Clarias gariepinus]